MKRHRRNREGFGGKQSDGIRDARRKRRGVIRPTRREERPMRAPGEPLPELLTPEEVAAWLKTTRKAIYAKAERGSLAGATYVGRRLYFLRAELLRSVEQARVPTMGDTDGGT